MDIETLKEFCSHSSEPKHAPLLAPFLVGEKHIAATCGWILLRLPLAMNISPRGIATIPTSNTVQKWDWNFKAMCGHWLPLRSLLARVTFEECPFCSGTGYHDSFDGCSDCLETGIRANPAVIVIGPNTFNPALLYKIDSRARHSEILVDSQAQEGSPVPFRFQGGQGYIAGNKPQPETEKTPTP